MASDHFGRQQLEGAKRGDLADCKSAMGNNADINFTDKDMRGALYYAIQEKSIPCVEFLISKGADVAIQDNKGDTIMHVACESNYKNMVQFLLLNGQDYKTPNLSEELPGQNNGEIKALMSEVIEEELCFGKVPDDHMARLKILFEEIDYDNQGFIDEEKASKFNKFVDKRCSSSLASRDAGDFIGSCSIIDGETVTLEEWMYAWAKLYVSEERVYNKFFTEYENVCSEVGMDFKMYVAQEAGGDYDL